MTRTHRLLAGLAIVLGTGALLSDRAARPGRGTADLAPHAAAVGSANTRVEPLELARWIRDRRPGLTVWDVRTEAAWEDFHVPGAALVPPGDILAVEAPPRFGTLVVYGADGAASAEAALLLRLDGLSDVRALDRGVLGWLDEVMMPIVPDSIPPENAEAWAAVAELAEYFGGHTHAESSVPPERWRLGAGERSPDAAVASVVRDARRRGCGF